MLFMSVAAVWIALLFWVRQRAINELRANNLTLRQQIDAPVLLPAAVGAPVVQQTNSVLPLNSGEQTELLRLRGQMATLRREMQEMSNRVATLLHSRRPSASVETNPSPSAKQANKDGNIHQAMNEFYRSESYLNAQSLGLALKA